MKKIIAAAVATAFVAPAFAADVTLNGEIEVQFVNGDNANTTKSDTAELEIGASDEFANGLSVSAYILEEGGSNANFLSVSGPFGTVSTGTDGDSALGAYEDKADVGREGGSNGGASTGSTAMPLLIEPNLGINGLSLGIGYAADEANGDMTDFAVAYEAMGLEVTYAQSDLESSEETTTVTSVAYGFGPVYVAIDSVENNEGEANNDAEAIAVTYDFGSVSTWYEQNEFGLNDAEETVFGAEYQVGPGLEVYVENIDEEGSAGDATVIGTEYKF